jgi:hypothetical protein
VAAADLLLFVKSVGYVGTAATARSFTKNKMEAINAIFTSYFSVVPGDLVYLQQALLILFFVVVILVDRWYN